MKRLLTTILSVAAVAICLSAATPQRKAISMSTGQEIPMQDIVPTSCVIDTTADGVTVSYHIENILLEPDSLYAGSYKCIISDFVNSDIEGAPAYPLRRDFIELPFGCSTATLTITKASFKDITCEMAPAYPFYIGSKLPVFTREHVLPINPCSFGSQSDIAVIDEITSYMSHPYVALTVNPCQYNSTDKVMRVYTDFEYRINYDPVQRERAAKRNAALKKRHSAAQEAMAKIKISIPDSLPKIEPAFPSFPLPDTTYLPVEDDYSNIYNNYHILTTPKYIEAAEEFAAFKRKMGFIVHISSRNDWTPELIQDTIDTYYNNMVDYYENRLIDKWFSEYNFYVLIMGGHADVPAMETEMMVLDTGSMQKHLREYITDYYYSCLNGSKNRTMPLGRLPVNTLEEAKTIIGKIKNYILNPPEDESFFHSGVHIAVHEGTDGGEDHPNIYDSEKCRDTIMKIRPDIDVKRLYVASENSNPQFCGYHNSQDYELPNELRRPNYPWDTDKYDIAEAINSGCFYTLYRGHGDTTEYVRPNLSVQDIKNGLFANDNKLPLFLNFTCLTGKFNNPGCLAESLLTNPDGGGIGVIAATVETNCQANSAICRKMLYDWLYLSKFDLVDSYSHTKQWCSELSNILNLGFFNNLDLAQEATLFHKTAYHLFGDPSMLVWAEQPRAYTEEEVWYMPHYNNSTHELINVEVLINLPGDEGCYIAIEDKETHETVLHYGANAIFRDFNPQTHSMIVYGFNRIPLEIDVPDRGTTIYGQDECLVFTPNPASSTCLIGYHNHSADQFNDYRGILTITNISTGKMMEQLMVKEHIGRIKLDVSKYPNGMYAVTLQSIPPLGSNMSMIIGKGKMIVQH